ncbi:MULTISPECIES: tRNA dihydrouridine synthase DusB [unclassified Aureimonas]|uniref:tRNA dihydrouridine synthase DusB n=1 Tax=unclassified Aureimonas TaxID=2615206 RepID=UPI0006F68DFA|nr:MULTISPECIES: tRNA dihydrouridine synthase DusB [unclassified Aureimonas]KQT60601.1 tRNA-dihydrouridine synthase [Aureimonas sp. Leaf427]KQT79474.1 tRNA-dihydrouridine synthase [Aureimonas sp. Leaf460]
MRLSGLTLPNRVFLAPLSGISDVPFRRLARRFGAGLVVSEMVASAEFVAGDAESALRAMRDGSGPHVVQLAGRDPVWMKAAAAKLADLGADLIDINMGCPAKKVVGGLSGSALMREPELALSIVEATVAGAGSVPVTLKMRLGWDERSLNAAEIAVRAESAGVRMITVHGRTRCQFYEGRADWAAIAAVKRAVSVPVVANGDLTAAADRPDMLRQSGADAVMIGRGACGRPWFPGRIAGATGADGLDRIVFADLVCEHYEAMLDHYGARTGIRHARKHLGWYLDTFEAAAGTVAKADRASVMTSTEPKDVLARLRSLLGRLSIADIDRPALAFGKAA